MVTICDQHGTITYANPATEAVTGSAPARVVGESVAAMLHPDDQTTYARAVARLLDTPDLVVDIRHRIRHHDGDWCWVEGTLSNMLHDPSVNGLVAILRDAGLPRGRIDADIIASEERYRSLFEAVDEGFCTIEILLDDDGKPHDYRFLNVNKTFERQTGLVDAEGKTARELVPNLEQFWFDMYGNVGLTGQPHRFEQYSEPMNRWFDVYTFRIGCPEELRVAIWFKDVTTRKAAEEALRVSEQRFRAVADLVPDLLWSNDAGGETDWYNQSWLTYTGQSADEAVATGWLVALHPEDQQSYTRTYQFATEHGEPLRQEFRIRDAEGEYHWFLVQVRPVLDETLRTVRWYGAATNIHQEWLALASAQVARASAEAALQTRDHFLSIASHELRTPLTSIIGYAQMLERRVKQGNGDVERLVDAISHQSSRLMTMLEQMLDLSRLQEGQFAIEYSMVDLVALIDTVVDGFRATLPHDNRHQVRIDSPFASLVVMADASRTEQVLGNLLSNAVKYSPHGGTVSVRLRLAASDVILEVQDEGLGIPASVKERLFTPFYRGNNVGPDISGFGLGLHVVHQIVQRHGGRIEIDSTEGEGSTFRVILPLIHAPDVS